MSTKVAKLLKYAIEQTEILNTGMVFKLSALFQPNYLDTYLSSQERDELETEYFLAYKREEIQDIEFKKEYMGKRSEYKKV